MSAGEGGYESESDESGDVVEPGEVESTRVRGRKGSSESMSGVLLRMSVAGISGRLTVG